MITPTPNSWGSGLAELTEYNHCHSPKDGKFCSTDGGLNPPEQKSRAVKSAPDPDKGLNPPTARPTPLKVNTVEEAIPLILQGKVVELRETRQVNTLLQKLAAMAQDAEARGEKAPKYDLCNVSVKGTNLFCADKLRTKEFPNGVPRLQMPQFAGEAEPGTAADRLAKSKKGKVDGAPAFIEHLKSLGIRTSSSRVPAAALKASQAELIGPKVAGMMTGRGYDPHGAPIFISRDNYVVDGHHRWAAVVGMDARDGKLGGLRMNVIRVDAPISEVLHIANRWTKEFGIKSKGVS